MGMRLKPIPTIMEEINILCYVAKFIKRAVVVTKATAKTHANMIAFLYLCVFFM